MISCIIKMLFETEGLQRHRKPPLPTWGFLSPSDIHKFPNFGLLGRLAHSMDCRDGGTEGNWFGNLGELVYLNTHHPFCYVAMGVQGSGKFPTFAGFKVEELDFMKSQNGPLQQRLNSLNSFIAESKENSLLLWTDMNDCGSMVVVDLTDPMIAPQRNFSGFLFLFFLFLEMGKKFEE